MKKEGKKGLVAVGNGACGLPGAAHPPKRHQVEMQLTDAAVGGLHRHAVGAEIALGALLAVYARRVVLGRKRDAEAGP